MLSTILPPCRKPSPSLLLLLLLLACLPLHAQQHQKLSPATTLTPIPPGLTLPIQIGHALHAGSTKPGTPITATTTQRIPLANHLYLHHGARVLGTVIASNPADPRTAQPASLTLRFTTLRYKNQTVPITARILAIANFTQVDDTRLPANGATDRGNSNPASWTTQQIGQDEVYRSGWVGPVFNATSHRVGFADYSGVYADPPPNATGNAAIPRAMGVFSTTAHGLYGFEDGAAIQSSLPDTTITSPHSLVLRDGDHLLLEVLPNPASPSNSSSQSPQSR